MKIDLIAAARPNFMKMPYCAMEWQDCREGRPIDKTFSRLPFEQTSSFQMIGLWRPAACYRLKIGQRPE
ncbi:MAG: hypothetical protein PVI58_15995, partial [Desulfobacterales bacterium]